MQCLLAVNRFPSHAIDVDFPNAMEGLQLSICSTLSLCWVILETTGRLLEYLDESGSILRMLCSPLVNLPGGGTRFQQMKAKIPLAYVIRSHCMCTDGHSGFQQLALARSKGLSRRKTEGEMCGSSPLSSCWTMCTPCQVVLQPIVKISLTLSKHD